MSGVLMRELSKEEIREKAYIEDDEYVRPVTWQDMKKQLMQLTKVILDKYVFVFMPLVSDPIK